VDSHPTWVCLEHEVGAISLQTSDLPRSGESLIARAGERSVSVDACRITRAVVQRDLRVALVHVVTCHGDARVSPTLDGISQWALASVGAVCVDASRIQYIAAATLRALVEVLLAIQLVGRASDSHSGQETFEARALKRTRRIYTLAYLHVLRIVHCGRCNMGRELAESPVRIVGCCTLVEVIADAAVTEYRLRCAQRLLTGGYVSKVASADKRTDRVAAGSILIAIVGWFLYAALVCVHTLSKEGGIPLVASGATVRCLVCDGASLEAHQSAIAHASFEILPPIYPDVVSDRSNTMPDATQGNTRDECQIGPPRDKLVIQEGCEHKDFLTLKAALD
jgi:hypothetical protein